MIAVGCQSLFVIEAIPPTFTRAGFETPGIEA